MKIIRLFYLLLVGLVLLAGYAWLVEPERLVVRRVVIRDSVLAQSWPWLTIVHLSDTHIGRVGAREQRLVAAINGLYPDLIVMSGDFKQWQADPGPAQQFLGQLSAPLGVYGVLGDSDQDVYNSRGCAYCHPGDRYHERLARPVILRNELRSIDYQGGRIHVAGLDLDGEDDGKWLARLSAQYNKGHEPLLILSHQSRLWRNSQLPVHSLWLCGDTHGGQVWMPDWVWRLIPYKSDSEHMGGMYGNGQGGWLIVNRGIGMTVRFPFRLGVLPELVVISFVESDGDMAR